MRSATRPPPTRSTTGARAERETREEWRRASSLERYKLCAHSAREANATENAYRDLESRVHDAPRVPVERGRMIPALDRRILGAACLVAALAACARGGMSRPPVEPTAPRIVETRPACEACAADATRYLRQLSLDLRGRPPTMDELASRARPGDVPLETIDAM